MTTSEAVRRATRNRETFDAAKQGRRRKVPVTLPELPTVHDRRIEGMPLNANLAPIEVDDPYSKAGQTDRIVVMRSLRDDPLGREHAHGRLDEAQYRAGRYWQYLYETSSVGSVQAVDTSKEPVDGRQFPEMTTDQQRKSLQRLAMAAADLGKLGNALIHDVLGHRMFLSEVAASRGTPGRHGTTQWSFFFRQCLDVLAVSFNLAGKKPE